MQIAKTNVIKNFPVVGVLEMFNTTLDVLEHKLPQYFKGAKNAFYNNDVKTYANTQNKDFISEKIKNIVRQNLTHEIEFYDFCCQRLQRQHEKFKRLMLNASTWCSTYIVLLEWFDYGIVQQ